MRKRFFTLVTLVVTLAITSFTGCSNGTSDETTTKQTENEVVTETTTEKATSEETATENATSESTTTENTTSEVITSESITTEETPTEEEPPVAYADWIDALYTQMIDLDFDSVIATISTAEFLENCSSYESGHVSSAYKNQCYTLPVSTGGQIGIVHAGGELTVFICPNDTDEHIFHRNGFETIGYGDICVVYSEEGTVTCDGIHVKSAMPYQSSFDMAPGDIWIVWSV